LERLLSYLAKNDMTANANNTSETTLANALSLGVPLSVLLWILILVLVF